MYTKDQFDLIWYRLHLNVKLDLGSLLMKFLQQICFELQMQTRNALSDNSNECV